MIYRPLLHLQYKIGSIVLIFLFCLFPYNTESHIKTDPKDIHHFFIAQKLEPEVPVVIEPQPRPKIKVPVKIIQREYFDFVKLHLKSKGARKEFDQDLLSKNRIHHYVNNNFFNGHVDRCLKIAKKMNYFAYIVPAFERHKIPNTFSLLPVIESCFDPQAISHAKAVGMWQINRITAKHLDLRIQKVAGGWTEDERYNWKKSTKAAAEYILFLKERFPTWELVLAAYNLGPTKLREQINKYKTINIDYLNLPRETRNYVYKFIAMTEIIKQEKL